MARKTWDVYRYEWFASDGKAWRNQRVTAYPARWAAVTEHVDYDPDDQAALRAATDPLKATIDAERGRKGGNNRPYAYSRHFERIASVRTRKEAQRLADLYSRLYAGSLQPARYAAILKRSGLKDFAALVDPANRSIVRKASRAFAEALDIHGADLGYATTQAAADVA
ncbi:hypothetical protein GII30_14930 [Gordonia amarae]|mgnify:CR=1 FL=1|uniref:Uncharacterized protein n=2 Tax=Gordonia amarae TaxID=36821 RepID=G7GJY0_9ACTN|nr:hypothetical protein [Gordonia amarae]MCS3879698.1 hypothetical protein [Gordonia amarae]QHN18138.1 hypothetical protein GII35_15245 [Gordonia amarae]QHN31526.1 hypothetical protein GII32_15095 [Gordonia amarae]QHN40269.1 hypothetical protein GII30_14930 [Gordonia amarae]GAB03905.1 hypothetical protein GOAMR_06_01110 [Gordonia amarae NBRC 15530]